MSHTHRIQLIRLGDGRTQDLRGSFRAHPDRLQDVPIACTAPLGTPGTPPGSLGTGPVSKRIARFRYTLDSPCPLRAHSESSVHPSRLCSHHIYRYPVEASTPHFMMLTGSTNIWQTCAGSLSLFLCIYIYIYIYMFVVLVVLLIYLFYVSGA